MSLRYFHIVFIALSVILTAGVAIWGIHDFRLTGDLLSLSIGLAAAILILPILIYARWLWRKSRRLIGQAIVIGVIPFLVEPPAAHACSVCAVDPNSLIARGAFWGILVLGLIVASLLATVAGVGLYWMHRARQLNSHV